MSFANLLRSHGQMMDQYPELYPLWQEALDAKYYGSCEPFGPREYNKLLGNYNVSSNFPGTLVAEDLIKAYPNAKVILTTRDVDSWLVSMKNSVDKAFQWRSFDWIAPWDPVSWPRCCDRRGSCTDQDTGRRGTVVGIPLFPAPTPEDPGTQRRASSLLGSLRSCASAGTTGKTTGLSDQRGMGSFVQVPRHPEAGVRLPACEQHRPVCRGSLAKMVARVREDGSQGFFASCNWCQCVLCGIFYLLGHAIYQ